MAAGINVFINAGAILTDKGTLTVTSPASFVVQNDTNQGNTSGIVVNGVMTVSDTKFSLASNGNDTTKIEVKSGGHLTTNNTAGSSTVFGWAEFLLDEGSILSSGDLTGNAFDTTVFTPAVDVPLLTNNQSFQDVDIDSGDTLGSGLTASFTQMGTVSTANLLYVIPGAFTVAATATLTMAAGINVFLNAGAILTDKGTLTVTSPASFVVQNDTNQGNTSGIVVNGVMTVSDTKFSLASNGNDTTKIEVKSGGHLTTDNTANEQYCLWLGGCSCSTKEAFSAAAT